MPCKLKRRTSQYKGCQRYMPNERKIKMFSTSSPCYDVKTKTDCPNRKLGCRKDCTKWAEYEEMKSKVYAYRKAVGSEREFINDVRKRVSNMKITKHKR